MTIVHVMSFVFSTVLDVHISSDISIGFNDNQTTMAVSSVSGGVKVTNCLNTPIRHCLLLFKTT